MAPQVVGVGFRRELADALLANERPLPHFLECAPENWIGVGGRWGRAFSEAAEKYPFHCHGLSLSLGSVEPLDFEFLGSIKQFLKEINAGVYSEHLSFSKCDNAHLYDLLPIPFTEEAVHHVAARIREAQEFLGRRIAIENISYYALIAPEMSEVEFIRSIVQEADCDLLLDLNNVYVNAHNHGYDAKAFCEALPLERVVYIHMAGHEDGEMKIDTHGEPICDDVYGLLEWIVPKIGPVPILLERDSNIPPFDELYSELERIDALVRVTA